MINESRLSRDGTLDHNGKGQKETSGPFSMYNDGEGEAISCPLIALSLSQRSSSGKGERVEKLSTDYDSSAIAATGWLAWF